MDLKNINNKNVLSQNIADMLSEYQELFTTLLLNETTYKKAALLYYWLRDYKNYIKNEENFSPNFYPEFYRGSLVNLNLGFNLGSEMGGLHYAIVLQDSNRRNPNLVVVPLTSVKANRDISHLRSTEVYLGEELYFKIQGKYEALKVSLPTELELLKQTAMISTDQTSKEKLLLKLQDLESKADLLVKTKEKLSALKHGSIVVMNQIRTVSKMRIIDPTDKYDILYGLRLSTASLSKIDKRLISLYTHIKA